MHLKEKIYEFNKLFQITGLMFIFMSINWQQRLMNQVNDRNTDYEIKRQREIEKELNCVFIRTNPDAADFNINKLNNQIFKHIIQSKEEKLKNKFAKELLSYVSSIFIPLKPIKYFVKKILSTL